jgi:hypothetical protein
MSTDTFEVKNETIQKLLKDVGHTLKDLMPKGWSFTLMMFDTDTTDGSMFYISGAKREDMIKAMEEFIQKNKI